MANEKTLKNGTKVKTVYGEWVTIMSVWDNIATVYENGPRHIHITKLMLSTAK